MSDHMVQQMDRMMDRNMELPPEMEGRCVPGCGYRGPCIMRGWEIEKLEARVRELEEENERLRNNKCANRLAMEFSSDEIGPTPEGGS